jgi:hypothetical protein
MWGLIIPKQVVGAAQPAPPILFFVSLSFYAFPLHATVDKVDWLWGSQEGY